MASGVLILQVLKEFVTILGPWIKDLAGDKKPIGAVRPLKKAEKPATPRDSRESSAKKETKGARLGLSPCMHHAACITLHASHCMHHYTACGVLSAPCAHILSSCLDPP